MKPTHTPKAKIAEEIKLLRRHLTRNRITHQLFNLEARARLAPNKQEKQ